MAEASSTNQRADRPCTARGRYMGVIGVGFWPACRALVICQPQGWKVMVIGTCRTIGPCTCGRAGLRQGCMHAAFGARASGSVANRASLQHMDFINKFVGILHETVKFLRHSCQIQVSFGIREFSLIPVGTVKLLRFKRPSYVLLKKKNCMF